MKALAVTILAVIVLNSCTKEKHPDQNIIGHWKWEVQYLGSPASILTPQNTGINESLIFEENNNWSLFQNDRLKKSGTFTIRFIGIQEGKRINALYYRNTGAANDSIEYYYITDSTLLFSKDLSGSIGGGARLYSRI